MLSPVAQLWVLGRPTLSEVAQLPIVVTQPTYFGFPTYLLWLPNLSFQFGHPTDFKCGCPTYHLSLLTQPSFNVVAQPSFNVAMWLPNRVLMWPCGRPTF